MLTDRERDVVAAIGRGASNAEIGRELYLTLATVKAHVSSVLLKLGLENRTQVALLARDAEPVLRSARSTTRTCPGRSVNRTTVAPCCSPTVTSGPSSTSGRVALDPYEPAMLQPSSIDVRLDRYFRLFDNHKYPFIDPAADQPDLTRLVEVDPGESFVLHPGEFVLGSTYEAVTLPDDIAARLEGKSSLGRLGLLTHSTAGFIDPGFSGHVTLELSNVATLPILLWPGHEDRPDVLLPAVVGVGAPLRVLGVRLAVPGAARPDRLAVLPELPPHGRLRRWRGSPGSPPTTPVCATATSSRCRRTSRRTRSRCWRSAGSPARGGRSGRRTRCSRAGSSGR